LVGWPPRQRWSFRDKRKIPTLPLPRGQFSFFCPPYPGSKRAPWGDCLPARGISGRGSGPSISRSNPSICLSISSRDNSGASALNASVRINILLPGSIHRGGLSCDSSVTIRVSGFTNNACQFRESDLGLPFRRRHPEIVRHPLWASRATGRPRRSSSRESNGVLTPFTVRPVDVCSECSIKVLCLIVASLNESVPRRVSVLSLLSPRIAALSQCVDHHVVPRIARWWQQPFVDHQLDAAFGLALDAAQARKGEPV